ncbi:NAD-dependent epimerase/dehydratase family protein [Halioglobus maricola]|uniref:NAD-dependent epimerase/dehydratase family protein n=1 Tax=Halioglobus maricola TaxID=2601894 RepID=A0A5P9NKS9_9GAMM|nr:NAD-dependent epimerase/dehydratase family protein [Halioglobus maricola]QFU76473.1 NAD-dependent epimerase/dehydratase family protein [Halioglobus maricola]
MHIFVLGMGHVGKALAAQLRASGHRVTGSTTTPGKVDGLLDHADDVVVLKGSETEKLHAAAAGCDAIIVTVAPDVKKTKTIEERHEHYHEVLVKSCHSARLACPHVIFLSSFSVYGDGGNEEGPVSETTPTANKEEPSSRYYQEAEQEVLSNTEGCVLRFPDMYGAPGDLSFEERVALCHQYFGGKAIFSADAPLYAIHFEDVVNAVRHALVENLRGVFNVCDNDNIPHSNKEVFDAICVAAEMAPLEFLDQIKAPLKKISAARIYATGYKVSHADPNAHLFQ